MEGPSKKEYMRFGEFVSRDVNAHTSQADTLSGQVTENTQILKALEHLA